MVLGDVVVGVMVLFKFYKRGETGQICPLALREDEGLRESPSQPGSPRTHPSQIPSATLVSFIIYPQRVEKEGKKISRKLCCSRPFRVRGTLDERDGSGQPSNMRPPPFERSEKN